MKIGRLDEVVKNNVEFSTNPDKEAQKLWLLQDISTTLAMIYDKLNGGVDVEEEEEQPSFIVPFDDIIRKYGHYFFDSRELPEPYEVDVISIETALDMNTGNNKIRIDVRAFGNPMCLNGNKYNKEWRFWNKMPTPKERLTAKWE